MEEEKTVTNQYDGGESKKSGIVMVSLYSSLENRISASRSWRR